MAAHQAPLSTEFSRQEYWSGLPLELDCEEGWVPKNWCFWTLVLEKTLESPLDWKEINQSILKEISPEYSLEGLMLKLKLQYFGHLMRSTDSFEKFVTILLLLFIFWFFGLKACGIPVPRTSTPCIGRRSLSHPTIREGPGNHINNNNSKPTVLSLPQALAGRRALHVSTISSSLSPEHEKGDHQHCLHFTGKEIENSSSKKVT